MRPPQDGSNNHNYKHGGKGTRLYNIWKDILKRCSNPKHIGYKYYGAKGIKRCEEWADFNVFKAWSLDNGYQENLTIDRIDFDKNYQPDNCRWVTQAQQNANKSTNVFLQHEGAKITLAEYARRTGIKQSRASYLNSRGAFNQIKISNG